MAEAREQWTVARRQGTLAEHGQGVLAVVRQRLGRLLRAVLMRAPRLDEPQEQRRVRPSRGRAVLPPHLARPKRLSGINSSSPGRTAVLGSWFRRTMSSTLSPARRAISSSVSPGCTR